MSGTNSDLKSFATEFNIDVMRSTTLVKFSENFSSISYTVRKRNHAENVHISKDTESFI